VAYLAEFLRAARSGGLRAASQNLIACTQSRRERIFDPWSSRMEGEVGGRDCLVSRGSEFHGSGALHWRSTGSTVSRGAEIDSSRTRSQASSLDKTPHMRFTIWQSKKPGWHRCIGIVDTMVASSSPLLRCSTLSVVAVA